MKIAFDIETTGIDKTKNEILQLSIVDDKMNILFDEYFKPSISEWKEAEKINHITPDMVKDCCSIDKYKKKIISIFNSADLIITYNGNFFDIPFLEYVLGVDFTHIPKYDVMLEFADYRKVKNSWGYNKWFKLVECCEYFEYGLDYNAHNSKYDTLATMYCYRKLEEVKNKVITHED